jgi:Pyridine nucleotide-disulphide oxidoreductase
MPYTPGFLPMTTNADPLVRRALFVASEGMGVLRMLPAFDPDLVGWLMDKFHELGIDVRTRATVESVHKPPHGRFAFQNKRLKGVLDKVHMHTYAIDPWNRPLP